MRESGREPRPFERVASACALLFVPGTRPDRFRKAVDSGADGIVLDLEDSVPTADKVAARENVERWFQQGNDGLVRINGVGTRWYEDDLAMLSDERRGVMVPKVTSASQLEDVLDRLPSGSFVVPTLETATGIFEARSIAAAPRVARLVFGNGDLAAQLGVDHSDWAALAWARSMIVMASAASGIASPLDGVTTALDDDAALTEDCQRAAAMGFGGKLCIHPKQVPVVTSEMSPTEEQLEWARKVVRAAEAEGVAVIDSEMIDGPVVERARRLLARWF